MSRVPVGITVGPDSSRDGFYLLREDYVRSVERAGGLPLVLVGRPEDAPELLDHVRALLLTGGGDVDPALYGQARHANLKRVAAERDAFELALVREALSRDLPVLGICRGHQVLNVATGGTLVQDIPSQIEGAGSHDPDVERWETAHEVTVLPGTRLRQILGKERVAVNSFHHQAVQDLGRGLVISARADGDDVVEGIESTAHRFVLGVQWHPEGFWNRPQGFHSLFDALVEAGR
jgi:putative glutamine amidotransferase